MEIHISQIKYLIKKYYIKAGVPLNESSIAFFWIGEKVEIPQVLVNSIRLVMGNEINVIQLTNKSTNEVEGVNEVRRFDLSNQIMVARLEAYSQYVPQTENTFFCDADSIFINKLKLPESNSNKIFLSPRKHDFKINNTYPEFYEEFVGKTANEVMPFLFCAIATQGNQQIFFETLLETCKKLPERFHRWYGDQYALFLETRDKLDNFKLLEPNIYQHEIKESLMYSYLEKAYNKGVQMLHFKGPHSKILQGQAIELLDFFYKKLNL